VRQAGQGTTVIGFPPGSSRDQPTAHAVAGLLTRAGMATDVADDIEPHIWLKLAVNCAINPLSALLRMPNGDLLAEPEPYRTLARAASEVGAVSAANGIDLAADPVAATEEVARRTAANRSSMLQDLERGAPTEVDALNGAVVRAARDLGIPTPVNEYLWRQVLDQEDRMLDAAAIDLDDLAGHAS
jgi:2-dehydropantoate 2-reductase